MQPLAKLAWGLMQHQTAVMSKCSRSQSAGYIDPNQTVWLICCNRLKFTDMLTAIDVGIWVEWLIWFGIVWCRDAFTAIYDMEGLGKDKQTLRERSAEQGGSGPVTWPQVIKKTSRGMQFPQEDLKGLNYIDTFLKFVGVVFREPRN